MSFKFDALMEILNKLDEGQRVTVQSLMDELEISERSLHRYIETLQTAKFPIIYDRQKGSYVFEDGYSLKKPHLTQEEILAFALAKMTIANLGPGMEKGLESIERKMSSKAFSLKGIAVVPCEPPSNGSQYIIPLQQAVNDGLRVKMTYRRLYDDQLTEREVDPYYLFFHDGFWNLRGYCRLRKEPRSFVLDRIMDLTVTERHFVPPNISAEAELSGAFGNYFDMEPTEVILRFDKEIRPHVAHKRWHQSETGQELPDGKLELHFVVNGTEEIKQWPYRWLPHVEVVSPKELREAVTAELSEALSKNR